MTSPGDKAELIVEKLTQGLLEDARFLYDEHARRCERSYDFYRLMKVLPALWDLSDRYRRLEYLHDRFSDRQLGGLSPQERINTIFVKMCLSIGTRRYDRYVDLFREMGDDIRLHPLRSFIKAAADTLSAPCFPNLEARKIFCIGLSRTGTLSLNQAISNLGVASSHFFNPFTAVPLEMEDFDILEAFSDTPVCVRFERLAMRYPKSIFIYSTRDIVSWEVSMRAHFLRVKGTDVLNDLKARTNRNSVEFAAQCGPYDHELYFNHDSLRSAYVDYDLRVRSFFADKKDRLLTIDVSRDDTWSAVCEFIDAKVPSAPFPHLNKAP